MNMVETMRPKGAVSSNRVFFRKAFLGKQVDGGTGQSSSAQGSPALGVGKPCKAISFRQAGEGDQIVTGVSSDTWPGSRFSSCTYCGVTPDQSLSLCDPSFPHLKNGKTIKPLPPKVLGR